MQKRQNAVLSGIAIVCLVVCLLFYVVLLRLPIPFLAGVAIGLSAYWLSYGAIRLGLFPVLKWLLLFVIYFAAALVAYGFWYTVHYG